MFEPKGLAGRSELSSCHVYITLLSCIVQPGPGQHNTILLPNYSFALTAAAFAKIGCNLVAAIMLPLIRIFPDMNID